MKYTITLNQNVMIEHCLNVPKMAILDILSVAPAWSDPVIVGDEVYYWVSRSKIAEELQAFEYKDDTIYRHLKDLNDLGFIDYTKQGRKDIVKLTPKGKSLFVNSEKNPTFNENSEINPEKVGKKSELKSEKNPTDKDTNIINITRDNIALPSFISREAWDRWTQHRKELGKKLTKTTIEQQIKKLTAWQGQGYDPNAIIDNAIDKGWYGLYLPHDIKQGGVNMMKVNDKDYDAPASWF